MTQGRRVALGCRLCAGKYSTVYVYIVVSCRSNWLFQFSNMLFLRSWVGLREEISFELRVDARRSQETVEEDDMLNNCYSGKRTGNHFSHTAGIFSQANGQKYRERSIIHGPRNDGQPCFLIQIKESGEGEGAILEVID